MEIKNMIIGGIAGMVSRTLTAPFELAKIQQQNSFMPNSTLKEVIKKEGITGLWKGNYSNCIRIFPQMAINYSIYQYVKPIVLSYFKNEALSNLISGGISGMIAMTVIYPMENARSRLSLQTNNNHYTGLLDVLKRTKSRELYNGLRMSLIGFTPYNALNFMFYNQYKNYFNSIGYDNMYINLFSGGLSGISAVTFTYPTDLIRRRLQLQGFDELVPRYTGIIDCIKKIYTSQGIKGFYGGLLMCYVKIFPAIALQFWTIELLKNNI